MEMNAYDAYIRPDASTATLSAALLISSAPTPSIDSYKLPTESSIQYSPILPNSTNVIVIKTSEREIRCPMPPLTISQQAELVASSLGINKTQFAEIFGVSRPTVYAWVKGTSEQPTTENANRLRLLAEILYVACKDSPRPIYHAFVEQPMGGESKSILSLLLEKAWNKEELLRLLPAAGRMTWDRNQNLAKMKPNILPSHSAREDILMDNLASLGMEG